MQIGHVAVTFARVVNKEPCTITKALGCACIICGVLVVLVTNGLLPHEDVSGLARLESDLIETPYLALTGLILCVIALALGAFATRATHNSKAIAVDDRTQKAQHKLARSWTEGS